MTTAEMREARSDLRSELDEVNADLEGMRYELEELMERIREAKSLRASLKARLAELRK